jgi:hypothetical protein
MEWVQRTNFIRIFGISIRQQNQRIKTPTPKRTRQNRHNPMNTLVTGPRKPKKTKRERNPLNLPKKYSSLKNIS